MIFFLILVIGIGIITFTSSRNKIIINKCPSPVIEQEIIEKVELEAGWICDKPKFTYDLLQPTGYYIGDSVECWKLETPIEQYNKEMCSKTKDDYFCKFIN